MSDGSLLIRRGICRSFVVVHYFSTFYCRITDHMARPKAVLPPAFIIHHSSTPPYSFLMS